MDRRTLCTRINQENRSEFESKVIVVGVLFSASHFPNILSDDFLPDSYIPNPPVLLNPAKQRTKITIV